MKEHTTLKCQTTHVMTEGNYPSIHSPNHCNLTATKEIHLTINLLMTIKVIITTVMTTVTSL